MPRASVNTRGNVGMSFGCLGTLVIGFLYLMAAVLFVGFLMLIAAVFVLAIVVALLARGIDRLLVAISATWRLRRAAHGQFDPVQKVIDTTATTTRSVQPRRRR